VTVYTLDKSAYLSRVLRENPSELYRLLGIGLTTAKYRYLKRCIGKGTVVGRRTEIINSAHVHIGSGCLLQDAVYIRAGTEGNIVIGDRSALNSFCRLFGHGSIEIGEDTQIGPGSLITTTDHDYHQNLERHYKRVVIGRGVWIGANVTVLPGVEIGDFAVIGAGTVVTTSIPSRAIAVGVPARVIKYVDDVGALAAVQEASG
jgi:acetyltransferase-like isoleucine patch superfamily enzyme